MPDLDAVLAMADRLVRDDERARRADQGKRRERRNRDRNRRQSEQRDRPDCPPPEDPAGRSEEKRDVPEE